MRKFNEWLRNLSLSQQLFVLIFFFITFFASFFFVFLTGKVDEFIQEQMFLGIDRSQITIKNLYDIGVEPDIIMQMSYQNKDSSMFHVFYTETGNYSTDPETINKNSDLSLMIRTNLKKQIKENEELGHYVFDQGNTTSYFAINVMGKNFNVVTIATNEYRIKYRDALLSSVVNVTVLVVGGFFYRIDDLAELSDSSIKSDSYIY